MLQLNCCLGIQPFNSVRSTSGLQRWSPIVGLQGVEQGEDIAPKAGEAKLSEKSCTVAPFSTEKSKLDVATS